MKSTETDRPTNHSGATRLSPIGDSFIYLEILSINHGNNAFVSFERTDFT